MPKLYILCGPSGCGKSTWAQKFMDIYFDEDIRYVSRDEIRFSLVKEDEEYFSHEKEVFRKFAATLALTLSDGFDVIADATHITKISRQKLTQAIDRLFTDYQIVYVNCYLDEETCVIHNSARAGRLRVPENVVRNMCRQYEVPSLTEDSRAIEIIGSEV